MSLPIQPPLPPMEAESVEEIPSGPEWSYEPKWDGFRCLVFRDGEEVELQSKAGQPLGRYFPEIVEAARALKPRQFILDGELAIPQDDRLAFDLLLQRVHPAASRVQKLSRETPAICIVFDLLADGRGRSLLDQPQRKRRAELEKFATHFDAVPLFRLSPVTDDLKIARQWLEGGGGSLDGVMAKRVDLPYQSGERTGMQKIKLIRSADCVVGGFRYASKGRLVGSLLLGLYDESGLLHHVGFCSGLKGIDKKALTAELEALIEPPGFTGNAPGGPSRWSNERSAEWKPLRPQLVVEVAFDHVTGQRFRHGTRFLRWRPDKKPRQCTLEQIGQPAARLPL